MDSRVCATWTRVDGAEEMLSKVVAGLRTGLWILIGGIVVVLGSAGSASAARPALVPPGFSLRASHGYRLSVLALGDPRAGSGFVVVTLRSRHAEASYFAPAAPGPNSLEADLGALGRLDVHFVPSGQPRSERAVCGKPALVEGGRYEGTIDFEGEEGYSRVHATSARGEAKGWLGILCPSRGSEGTGGHSPGARLTARQRGASGFGFSAMTNSPSRPVRFVASVRERRGDLKIERSVTATAASHAFDFDVPSGEARVRPPRPFAGTATYRRRPGGRPRWRGGLRVDFPGRSDVWLTGPGTRASLIRAVVNPGHPF